MKPISVHVVDIANGVVARGMRVQVVSLRGDTAQTVFEGTVGNNGLVEDLQTELALELRAHFLSPLEVLMY